MDARDDRPTAPILSQTSPLALALAEIAQWRVDEERYLHDRRVSLVDEERTLRREAEALNVRLQQLEHERRTVEVRTRRLDAEATRRARRTLLRQIKDDIALLQQRNDVLASTVGDRIREIQTQLLDPEVARALQELERLRAAEQGLREMPVGYRRAIRSRNAAASRRAAPLMNRFERIYEPVVSGKPDRVGIVASLDVEDEVAGALGLVLPVPFDVAGMWADRGEDLPALLAWRVVAALGAALNEAGAHDAPLQWMAFEDALAVQVWLGDSELTVDIRGALHRHLLTQQNAADELRAANVVLGLVWVDVDLLLPEANEHLDA